MNSEITRLQTFCNWPASAPVDPSRIAKAGFYYTGTELEVQCFSCQGKINNWDYGDQVMWRHRQLKPNCPFVIDPMNSGNIPNMDMFECDIVDEPSQWHVEESLNDEDSGPQEYGLTEEDVIYRSDPLRLLSFINWDDASVSREALVNAGFYHTGDGRLRCAWCGGELTTYIRSIHSLENLADVHRMFFPRCDRAATVEAAQSSNSNIVSQPSSPPSATPPIRSPEINESAILSSGAAHNSRILNAGNTWRALGVISSGARHPNHASLTTRLATFDRWPADKTQLPRSMAEAGFFLTGADDQVRCFYCDGGLGRWEDGDEPWSEHARWFPTCGYVLLVKGPEYVEQCRDRSNDQRSVQAPNNNRGTRRNTGFFPDMESQIDECMESPIVLGALCAGLDAARVRRALVRRLQTTGTVFTSSEALIDAVLDDQLSEEPWSVNTQHVATHRFAHDILAETLRELGVPDQRGIADSTASESDRTRTPSPLPAVLINRVPRINLNQVQPSNERQTTSQSGQSKVAQKRESESERRDSSATSEPRDISLEEENRQLKEARLCKVCMDSEVSVVFLPCGHLVSCARCGAALAACPLCRSPVKALVRAYLA